MQTYLTTLLLCLAPSIATGQFLQTPDADTPAADAAKPNGDKEKSAVGERAERGAAGERRGPGGPGALRGGVEMMNPMFAAIDVDGDGVITRNELKKAIVQLRTLDTDKDGNITLAEASPQGMADAPMGGMPGGQFGDPQQMVDRIMQSDKNGDGKLTAEEIPGPMAQQMIQNGDKDGDNALSRDELMQGMKEMQDRMRNWQGGPGGFQGAPGAYQWGPGSTAGGQNQMIGQMMLWDRNHDNKVETSEAPAAFHAADADNNGVIDPREMRLFIERNGDRLRGALGRGQSQNGGRNEKGERDDNGKNRERRGDRND
jgi:Ca2+-binding EF-hand superfamily protein